MEQDYCRGAFARGGSRGNDAKVHKVARVAMFGGPTDYSQRLLRVAPWLSAPHATPIESYYALNHTKDTLRLREATWKALGMDGFGGPVNVDSAASPFGNSHELVTSVATGNPHGSVAVDAAVPMKDGVPVFRDAWEYMAFGWMLLRRGFCWWCWLLDRGP